MICKMHMSDLMCAKKGCMMRMCCCDVIMRHTMVPEVRQYSQYELVIMYPWSVLYCIEGTSIHLLRLDATQSGSLRGQ